MPVKNFLIYYLIGEENRNVSVTGVIYGRRANSPLWRIWPKLFSEINSFYSTAREKSPVVFYARKKAVFMFPVLYPPNAADFSSFGPGVLTDTVSCKVTEERSRG